MKTIKYICDICGEDLTGSTGMPKFRLILSCESIPITSGFVYDVLVLPPIHDTMCFCGLPCLKEWVEIYDNT